MGSRSTRRGGLFHQVDRISFLSLFTHRNKQPKPNQLKSNPGLHKQTKPLCPNYSYSTLTIPIRSCFYRLRYGRGKTYQILVSSVLKVVLDAALVL